MSKKRVSFRAEDEFIEELNEILNDINKDNKPNQKDYGVKNIVWDFMKEYTKTQPYGLVTETKRLKTRLDEIEDEIENLTTEKNELTAQIKVNEEILNSKKLDDYKDKYTLKLEEAKANYNKRLSTARNNPDYNINEEELLQKVCKKYPEIRLQDLKKIL